MQHHRVLDVIKTGLVLKQISLSSLTKGLQTLFVNNHNPMLVMQTNLTIHKSVFQHISHNKLIHQFTLIKKKGQFVKINLRANMRSEYHN